MLYIKVVGNVLQLIFETKKDKNMYKVNQLYFIGVNYVEFCRV